MTICRTRLDRFKALSHSQKIFCLALVLYSALWFGLVAFIVIYWSRVDFDRQMNGGRAFELSPGMIVLTAVVILTPIVPAVLGCVHTRRRLDIDSTPIRLTTRAGEVDEASRNSISLTLPPACDGDEGALSRRYALETCA